MTRVIIAATVATALSGCASSQQIEEVAYRHERQAAQLETRGDYGKAASERNAATKQFQKAERRRTEEATVRSYWP
jgi:outer membrane murein-binding lipoprotein Lpp